MASSRRSVKPKIADAELLGKVPSKLYTPTYVYIVMATCDQNTCISGSTK